MAVGIHKYNFPYRYVSKWEYGYLGTNPSSFVDYNGEKINKEQKNTYSHTSTAIILFSYLQIIPQLQISNEK